LPKIGRDVYVEAAIKINLLFNPIMYAADHYLLEPVVES